MQLLFFKSGSSSHLAATDYGPTKRQQLSSNLYKTPYQLILWNWRVFQFLSITLSLALSLSLSLSLSLCVCISFSCVVCSFHFSSWPQTSLITELSQYAVSMTVCIALLSICQFTIFFVNFFPVVFFCDFNCVNNLQLALSKFFFVKSVNFDFWHVF